MQSVKAVWIGDGAVGKTCQILSYMRARAGKDPGIPEYIPTVVDNCCLKIPVQEHLGEGWDASRVVDLRVWDTGGGEDYGRLRPLSYPHTDVFVLCFDISNSSSLEHVRNGWIPEIMASPRWYPQQDRSAARSAHTTANEAAEAKTNFVIVANKTDLCGGGAGGASRVVRNPFADPREFQAWRFAVLGALRRFHGRAMQPHVMRHILSFISDPRLDRAPTNGEVAAWIGRSRQVDPATGLLDCRLTWENPAMGPNFCYGTPPKTVIRRPVDEVLSHFQGYHETSACTGEGLCSLFERIAQVGTAPTPGPCRSTTSHRRCLLM